MWSIMLAWWSCYTKMIFVSFSNNLLKPLPIQGVAWSFAFQLVLPVMRMVTTIGQQQATETSKPWKPLPTWPTWQWLSRFWASCCCRPHHPAFEGDARDSRARGRRPRLIAPGGGQLAGTVNVPCLIEWDWHTGLGTMYFLKKAHKSDAGDWCVGVWVVNVLNLAVTLEGRSPPGLTVKPLPTNLVLRIKRDENGAATKFKARLFVRVSVVVVAEAMLA